MLLGITELQGGGPDVFYMPTRIAHYLRHRLRGTYRQWLNGSDVRYSMTKRRRRRLRGLRKQSMKG